MAEPPTLNLQKPPGYRDPNAPVRPPPGQVHGKPVFPLSTHSKSRRRTFCHLCCCCAIIVLVILIILVIILGFLFLWFDPKVPVFHLQSFNFSSFNVASKSDGTYLNAAAVARVEVRNPNSKLAYRYGKSKVTVSAGYDRETVLGSTTLAGFTQGKKNTTRLKIVTNVKNEVVQDGVGSRLLKQYKSKALVVNVEVKTSVGLRWERMKIGMLEVEVLCGDVRLKHLQDGKMPRCVINMLKWINIR